MNYKTEFYSIFERTLRVGATFVALSVGGCLIGLALGVSPRELGVAVAVPILWLFAISRVFVAAMPRTPSEAKPITKSATALFFSLAAMFVAGIGAIDFALSGATFSFLRLHNLSSGSYRISATCGEICASVLLVLTALALREVFGDLATALTVVILRILRWPTLLADAVPPLHKLQHHR